MDRVGVGIISMALLERVWENTAQAIVSGGWVAVLLAALPSVVVGGAI
jgi:hypothetical protein